MPLGRGKVLELQRLAAIGRRLRKTPGQIALRWLVQQGVGAIPKSTHPERLRQNLEVFDFHLSDREMAEIFALARPDGRMIAYPRIRLSDGVTLEPHPEFAPAWDV
jgi:diketogulonate reductase-like aldo/keto reductase